MAARFDAETIEMLREVLERTWEQLPSARRSNTVKSELAERILKRAAEGERDPIQLKAAALQEPMVITC